MRRAIIRPISPEPKNNHFVPWEVAVDVDIALRCAGRITPAGRVPAIFSAPRGLSRQPMARITAVASPQ